MKELVDSIDEFGFIVLTDAEKKTMLRNRKHGVPGYAFFGCKDLCRFLPVAPSNYFFWHHPISDTYICSTCEIIMHCRKCRCCGRAGRWKPRTSLAKENARKWIKVAEKARHDKRIG